MDDGGKPHQCTQDVLGFQLADWEPELTSSWPLAGQIGDLAKVPKVSNLSEFLQP